MNEKLSDKQIRDLQQQFGQFEKLDPCSPTFKTLRSFVEGLPLVVRKQLAGAGIAWVSYLAKKTLPKEPLLVPACDGTETPITRNGRKYLWCWDRNKTGTFPGDHVYVDLQTDIPLSEEEYEAIFCNQ